MQELSQFVLKIAPIEGENLEWQRKCCNFAEVIGGMRERATPNLPGRERLVGVRPFIKKHKLTKKQKDDEQNL